MIVLVGFMGAGKSTTGRALAERLGLPFADTDELIEARAGRAIAEQFEVEGEDVFRARERAVVGAVLDGPEAVVALGGGAVEAPEVRDALRWATVVHLDVSLPEALRRAGDDGSRPLLRGRAGDVEALFERRRELYRSVANLTIPTDGRSPESIALEAAARLLAPARGSEDVRRVVVPLGERAYEVVIGAGVARPLGDAARIRLNHAEAAFVVTHPGLAQDAVAATSELRDAGLRIELLTIPEGEGSKSLQVASDLYRSLATLDAHRHDVVIAFGGGVVCDVAGFVASTFNRGMHLVHVPTTLLAQVDAAVGGKTGVNLPQGKNLVGTFYQPDVVVCDVALLASLPRAELISGLAEVVKYGLIAEPGLLDLLEHKSGDVLEAEPRLLVDLVARSVAIKAEVVGLDEREGGPRAHLNYGHTFAHAIERMRGFEGIRHGEAVAIGMMAAGYVAHEMDRIDDSLVDLHERVLRSVQLPVSADLELEQLEDAWRHDKKYRAGVRFVLLSGLARPEAGVAVPRAVLGAALERLAS